MPEQDENLFRMKKLCELAGVTRATVLYYISKGLIPKPIKSGRNMALYDQTHVHAIRVVKGLQNKRYFPLSVVHELLEKKAEDMTTDEKNMIEEVDGKVFLDQKWQKKTPMTATQLHKKTGLPLEEIRELEKNGFIQSIQEGKKKYFRDEDIRLVECWSKVHSIGFLKEQGFTPTQTLKIYKNAIDRLSDQEALLILNNMAGKVEPQLLVSMIEEALRPITILIEILHKRSIVDIIAKYGKAIS